MLAFKGSKLVHVLGKFPHVLESIYRIAYLRIGAEQLRAKFHGFEEAFLPHLSLIHLSENAILSKKLHFSISGTFRVFDPKSRTELCVVKDNIFFGSVSESTEYAVSVVSSGAFLFVLEDPSKMSEQDLALLRNHEQPNCEFFHRRGQLARERVDAMVAELLGGEEVPSSFVESLRRNDFSSKLLDLIAVSKSSASLDKAQRALAIRLLSKLEGILIGQAFRHK